MIRLQSDSNKKRMDESNMSLIQVYGVIQNRFDILDKQLGSRSKRRMGIRELPQDDRDLYLVADVVAITCNGGMGAWISYHHDEANWIDCARDAFIRIGHPQVAEGLRHSLGVYLAKRGSSTHDDYSKQSDYIFDHEEEIIRSLFGYLSSRNFVFRKSDG